MPRKRRCRNNGIQFRRRVENPGDDKQFWPIIFPQGELELNADFPPFLGGEEGRHQRLLCFYGAMSCYGSTFATQAAMAGIAFDEMKINLKPNVDFRSL